MAYETVVGCNKLRTSPFAYPGMDRVYGLVANFNVIGFGCICVGEE